MKFTIRWLMAAVAVAGWILVNIRLFAGMEDDLPSNNPTRIAAWRIMALIVSPSLGGTAAWMAWHGFGSVDSWAAAMLRGVIAGIAAGACAWFFAALLLCIGHAANGQTPLVAAILGVEGAAIHVVPGALLSGVWWWSRRSKRAARSSG
jgi:hypothetical protein